MIRGTDSLCNLGMRACVGLRRPSEGGVWATRGESLSALGTFTGTGGNVPIIAPLALRSGEWEVWGHWLAFWGQLREGAARYVSSSYICLQTRAYAT